MNTKMSLLLAGMLVIGSANSIYACDGAKKASAATSASVQVLPVANETSPAAKSVAPKELAKTENLNSAGCAVKESCASKAAANCAPGSKLTAEHTNKSAGAACDKGSCDMKSVERSTVPAPVEQSAKKAS